MAAAKVSKILNYQGLISAPFTPFLPTGEVDTSITDQYVDYLLKLGVKGVFVNGTTGEGLSLTVEERKRLAEAWVNAGKNKLDIIIVQVGANSITDAKELAAHAEKIGVTGIASLPPVFYKPPTIDHLVAFLKEIGSAAPNLPLMFYHIPSFSGVEVTISDLLPKAREAIPNFCGAKYTSTDVRDLLRCHRLPGPPFKLLSGFDEVLLPCLACGVTAAVGATYNFMGPLGLKTMEAYRKGDLKTATRYQQQVSHAVEKIISHGSQSISALKATMNILSPIDFGNPRNPLLPLSVEDIEKLKHDLLEMKANEWSTIKWNSVDVTNKLF